ncbi:hypothetical protein [Cupriavidus alkaliphilus]|uniref:hypothetical protein n=1 Tax=Cupriavidus alkaliphilus TaxID=942866 RepID=UPI00339D76E5
MVDIAAPERFRLSDLVQRYLQATGDKRAIVADPAALCFGSTSGRHACAGRQGTAWTHPLREGMRQTK